MEWMVSGALSGVPGRGEKDSLHGVQRAPHQHGPLLRSLHTCATTRKPSWRSKVHGGPHDGGGFRR